MQDHPITIADIALWTSIAVGLGSILSFGIKALLAFLMAKFGSVTPAQQMVQQSKRIAEQSVRCGYDHENLQRVLHSVVDTMTKGLEQNASLIKAISDSVHAAQMQHQAVMSQLAKHEEKTNRILEDLARRA
jgi:Mg2+ and Co2+ transporter CorA